jgi:hypothetical protein
VAALWSAAAEAGKPFALRIGLIPKGLAADAATPLRRARHSSCLARRQTNRHARTAKMIHELRIYQCIPGKLPALLKRFESKTLDIWKKHGIRPTGFWTVLIGEGNNDLHYLLAWESLAEREQKWNAFQADPDWHKARDESEKDGLLIANIKTSMLRPTAFSAIR